MKKDPVLEMLRTVKEGYVSGEEASKKLRVTRAAVWKSVEALRRAGYKIEAKEGFGYRLKQIPDKLFADEIQTGLQTRFLGKQVFSYEELDSTNDAAFALGDRGIDEGACVFAEYQKKGRGRLGRAWASPRGKNVLVSILLRPKLAPPDVPKLTLTAAVSIARTVEAVTGVKPGIKWPNDILYKNKKLCGILTEMSAEADRVKFVVLGIGLNVNSVAKELPPNSTSLRQMAGKPLRRQEVARRLLAELETDMDKLMKGRFAQLAEDWENYSVTTGRRVRATVLGRVIHGYAVNIDGDGALWIRRDDGLQERLLSGDVEHSFQKARGR